MASDFQPPPQNPYDSPEPVKPGMSSGAKVLLGLGIGCGVLVLLCCGGFGISIYFFGRSIQQAMSEDPAKVRTVAADIVTVDVPEDLEPKTSLNWTVPVIDKTVWMAIFADATEQAALVLFQLEDDLENSDMLQAQFKNSMQQSGSKWKEIQLEESETYTTEIEGKPAEFNVGKGNEKQSGREVWQAKGVFQGKGGAALLFMQLNAEDFTKDDVMNVLKSLK